MNKDKIIEMLRLYSKAINIDMKAPMYGIISHPLTSSSLVMKENKPWVLDGNNIEEYVDWRCDLIQNSAKNVDAIFVHINKPYRIAFLYFVKEQMDDKEFSETLNWIWTQTEYPHQESLHRLVELFKRAKKEYLMDKEEIAKIDSLPSIITIYRGLQGKKAKQRGLSWTLSFEKAKWFADRWQHHGKLLQAEIPRDAVFMYTNSREEQEIVVNPFRIQNLKEVQFYQMVKELRQEEILVEGGN